jgi:hypothetical protein
MNTDRIVLRVDGKTADFLGKLKNKSAYVRKAIEEKKNPLLFSKLIPFLGHRIVCVDLGNGSWIKGYANGIDDPVALNKSVADIKFGNGEIEILLK